MDFLFYLLERWKTVPNCQHFIVKSLSFLYIHYWALKFYYAPLFFVLPLLGGSFVNNQITLWIDVLFCEHLFQKVRF